jgi:hypothetical protein
VGISSAHQIKSFMAVQGSLVMMQALLADECTDQAAGRFDFW